MKNQLLRLFFRLPGTSKHFFGIYKRFIENSKSVRNKTKIVSIKGVRFELHLDDWIQAHMYFLNHYEQEETNLVIQKLPKGGTFIDIGANVGFYSLFAAQKAGSSGKIISFEPFPLNVQRLKRNISLNNFSRVEVVPMAVGNDSGKLDLYYSENEQNMGAVSGLGDGTDHSVTVDLIRLDDYLESCSIEKIDVIKIDIEGSEYDALTGMKQTLEKFKPAILIEISPEILVKTERTPDDIKNILFQLNYEITAHHSHNYLFQAKEP